MQNVEETREMAKLVLERILKPCMSGVYPYLEHLYGGPQSTVRKASELKPMICNLKATLISCWSDAVRSLTIAVSSNPFSRLFVCPDSLHMAKAALFPGWSFHFHFFGFEIVFGFTFFVLKFSLTPRNGLPCGGLHKL